jgi:hypothetical protein
LSIGGTAFIPRDNNAGAQSAIKNQIEKAVDPTQVPTFPAADAPKSTNAPVTAPPAEPKK